MPSLLSLGIRSVPLEHASLVHPIQHADVFKFLRQVIHALCSLSRKHSSSDCLCVLGQSPISRAMQRPGLPAHVGILMPTSSQLSSIPSTPMGPQTALLPSAPPMGVTWPSCPTRSAASWAGSYPGPPAMPTLPLMGRAPGFACSRMLSHGAKRPQADATGDLHPYARCLWLARMQMTLAFGIETKTILQQT